MSLLRGNTSASDVADPGSLPRAATGDLYQGLGNIEDGHPTLPATTSTRIITTTTTSTTYTTTTTTTSTMDVISREGKPYSCKKNAENFAICASGNRHVFPVTLSQHILPSQTKQDTKARLSANTRHTDLRHPLTSLRDRSIPGAVSPLASYF